MFSNQLKNLIEIVGPGGDAPSILTEDLSNLEINNESFFNETPSSFNYDEFTAFNLLIYKVALFLENLFERTRELLILLAFWRRFKRDGADGADRIGTCNLTNDRTW